MRQERFVSAASKPAPHGELVVRSPFDQQPVAKVEQATAEDWAAALQMASQARYELLRMPPHQRAAILEAAATTVKARRDDLATLLVEEAGKPLSLARVEVDRCVETLLESARVARTPECQLLDLSAFPSGQGRWGLLRRFPVGVVVGITPFNFPLNLVAHKLGPAVAAGCPILLKPASQTPSPALYLARILISSGLPPQALAVLPCPGQTVEPLLTAPEVRLVTFTGSAQVGWHLKQLCWSQRVTLELGGNAAVVVEEDAGHWEAVAQRIALGAFAYAGQSCISVQRVLVASPVYEQFRQLLVAAATSFPTGDPAAEGILCGPMISPADAQRLQDWVFSAQQAGARLLTPWRREGSLVWPQLLEQVPHQHPLWAEEAFAPVAVLEPFRDFEEALAKVNDSRFGLQCGLFTRDLGKIRRAWEAVEVGAVIAGDIPSWRSDPMPYGGVKQSGTGREGPAWAVESMTEPRLLVLSPG
ncbi:MAG: aldehyde dehydrogenase family protein [Thermoanaerobaculum sp.]|nr:aldehyde dehydrogenase family protein [Thermoanaerobaculum sp.]MDW7966586.1 aldehyde dehydrogenase family protein [Thermoanaerobaculum sp.]